MSKKNDTFGFGCVAFDNPYADGVKSRFSSQNSLKDKVMIKRSAWTVILILILASSALAEKAGFDYTKENASNGVLINTYNVFFEKAFSGNKLGLNVIRSERNGKDDITLSAGLTNYFRPDQYIFGSLSIAPTPTYVPRNTIKIEYGNSFIPSYVLVAGYELRDYTSATINSFMAGFDYYPSLPLWMVVRYQMFRSSDGTDSGSYYFKLYSDITDRLRAYIGYAFGSEAYLDVPTSTVIGFSGPTPMAGVQYKFTGTFTGRLDLSSQTRDNGVVNTVMNLGGSFEW